MLELFYAYENDSSVKLALVKVLTSHLTSCFKPTFQSIFYGIFSYENLDCEFELMIQTALTFLMIIILFYMYLLSLIFPMAFFFNICHGFRGKEGHFARVGMLLLWFVILIEV